MKTSAHRIHSQALIKLPFPVNKWRSNIGLPSRVLFHTALSIIFNDRYSNSKAPWMLTRPQLAQPRQEHSCSRLDSFTLTYTLDSKLLYLTFIWRRISPILITLISEQIQYVLFTWYINQACPVAALVFK
jgi:hypothetical protein